MRNSRMKFADQVRWRIRILWLMVIAMLCYMVIVGETGGGDTRMLTDLAERLSDMMFFGGLIWIGWRIIHNRKLLADRQLLKAQALVERDEYTRMLHLRSGGPVMDAMLLLLYVVTMTAALYNMDMFHVSLGLFAAAAALKAGAYLAARRGWM